MGMFDTVVSNDGQSAQVKCFGSFMEVFELGSRVDLVPVKRLETDVLPSSLPESYQVAVNDGTFITVLGGEIVAWDSSNDPELMTVDNYGQPWSGDPRDGAYSDPS